MEIDKLISVLESYPNDTILYNSGNFPYWKESDGVYVLSLVPVAKQKVSDLLYVLRALVSEDIALKFNKHKRRVYPGTPVHIDGYAAYKDTKEVITELLTDRTVRTWLVEIEEYINVKVGVGLPSYMVGDNNVELIVPRRYFLTMNNIQRIFYINKLLFAHTGRWVNPETGLEEHLDFDYKDEETNIPGIIILLGGFGEAEQE